mgnify:FL=1
MAGRAGSLTGIRLNGGPLSVKVTRHDFDPENKHNRSVTTDASQAGRTIVTQGGGILRCTGYVDPADTASAYLLAATGAPGTQHDVTAIKYIIDMSESAGSRKGYAASAGKLIINNISGQTDEGGMQEITFEVHSTTPGFAYSTALT